MLHANLSKPLCGFIGVMPIDPLVSKGIMIRKAWTSRVEFEAVDPRQVHNTGPAGAM